MTRAVATTTAATTIAHRRPSPTTRTRSFVPSSSSSSRSYPPVVGRVQNRLRSVGNAKTYLFRCVPMIVAANMFRLAMFVHVTTKSPSWAWSAVARHPVRHLQQRRPYARFRWSKDIVSFSAGQDEYDALQKQKQQQRFAQLNSTVTTAQEQQEPVVASRNSTDDIVELSERPTPANLNSTTGSDSYGQDGTAGSSQSDASSRSSPPPSTAEDTSFLAIDPNDVVVVNLEQEAAAAAIGSDTGSGTDNRQASVAVDASAVANPNGPQSPTFVNMFRGSANYIANHRNTLAVYHIPGDLMDMDDSTAFRDLMNDIALSWLLGMKIVIVAGCRYQIDQRLPDRVKHQGLTITDKEILRLVKEEAGYVRFEIERQLARSLRMQGINDPRASHQPPQQRYNYPPGSPFAPPSYSLPQPFKSESATDDPAAGTGILDPMTVASTINSSARDHGSTDIYPFDGNVVSGNFYTAQPFGILDGIDFKYTGFVRRVEIEKIRQVHNNRDIVLLTALGVSPSGEVFNVNSESLAATVAGSMEASKIVFFTESDVELRHKVHGNKIHHLRVKDAHNLLKHYGISVHKRGFLSVGEEASEESFAVQRNMLIKIGWSMHALEQGVKRAHIISPKHGALLQELYTRDGGGTMLSRDLYDGIRQAKVEDVSAIHDLISPLIRMGTLVDRPKAVLEKTVSAYHVYTRDDLVVACGQLKLYENGFAEIGCLVVDKNYRARGRGDAMLGYLERLSLQKGASYVFVLSTQTMEWFIERGFDEVGVDMLPPSRQAVYDKKRNSKIYMKKINSVRDLDASELWWNR